MSEYVFSTTIIMVFSFVHKNGFKSKFHEVVLLKLSLKDLQVVQPRKYDLVEVSFTRMLIM